MAKETEFRDWLRLIWIENCDEHDAVGELPYTMEEYFRRYKWWLRREFRYQRSRPRYQSPEIKSVTRPINVSGC